MTTFSPSPTYGSRAMAADLALLRERGACVGWPTEWFYPSQGSRATKARAICAVCPVRAECLRYVLETGEPDGVWGGTAEKDRRPLHKLRRRGVAVERIIAMVLAGDLDGIMAASRSRGAPLNDEERESAIREAVAVLVPIVASRRGESLSEAIDRHAADAEAAREAARVLGLAA